MIDDREITVMSKAQKLTKSAKRPAGGETLSTIRYPLSSALSSIRYQLSSDLSSISYHLSSDVGLGRLFWEWFKIALFVVGGGYAIFMVADEVFGRLL